MLCFGWACKYVSVSITKTIHPSFHPIILHPPSQPNPTPPLKNKSNTHPRPALRVEHGGLGRLREQVVVPQPLPLRAPPAPGAGGFHCSGVGLLGGLVTNIRDGATGPQP